MPPRTLFPGKVTLDFSAQDRAAEGRDLHCPGAGMLLEEQPIRNRAGGVIALLTIVTRPGAPLADRLGLAVEEALDRGLPLKGAELSGANLAGMEFIDIDLGGACLDGARLHSATFREARLDGCSFRGADLT